VKLAAVQMISGPEPGPNLATAGRLIAEAVAAGAQFVALPEYFPLIGASDGDRLAARERDGSGPIQDFLAGAAREHGIWLVGGSIPLHADDPAKLRNSCLVYDPEGKRVARYDKIHLFGFRKGAESYDEAATIERGDQVVAFDTPFGRVGLAICYDLRFPELFRAMGRAGPAGAAGGLHRDHRPRPLGDAAARPRGGEPVLRAGRRPGRVAPERTHDPRQFDDGRSLGRVLARMDKGEGVVTADFDPQRIAEPAPACRR
jgi:predicted amidohydrolase